MKNQHVFREPSSNSDNNCILAFSAWQNLHMKAPGGGGIIIPISAVRECVADGQLNCRRPLAEGACTLRCCCSFKCVYIISMYLTGGARKQFYFLIIFYYLCVFSTCTCWSEDHLGELLLSLPCGSVIRLGGKYSHKAILLPL